MELEDMDRETLKRIATSRTMASTALFLLHPNRFLELLLDTGDAAATAQNLKSLMEQAEMGIVIGAIRNDPEHDEVVKAMKDAVEASLTAFEIVLDATVAMNELAKTCKCAPCQRRRGIKNAEHN